MPSTRKRAQRGLTLLEVLVALIILSVALSVFLMNFNTSLVGNERSQVYGKVASASLEAYEKVKLMSLEEIKALQATEVEHSQGGGISVTATARDVTSSDVGNLATLKPELLQHVNLATSFRNKDGQTVVKTFTSIIYKPE